MVKKDVFVDIRVIEHANLSPDMDRINLLLCALAEKKTLSRQETPNSLGGQKDTRLVVMMMMMRMMMMMMMMMMRMMGKCGLVLFQVCFTE